MKTQKIINGKLYELLKRFYWKDEARAAAKKFKRSARFPKKLSVRIVKGKYQKKTVWGIYFRNLK